MTVPDFTTLPDVLAVLRLKDGDRDQARLTAAVLGANRKVDNLVRIGRSDDDMDALAADDAVMVELGAAAVTIAKNLYKREADPMCDAMTLIGSHLTPEALSSLFGV